MTEETIILLVADAETDRIKGITETGKQQLVFAAAPPLPGISSLVQDDDGRLFVACAASHEIICLAPDGQRMETFTASSLQEPGCMDLDVAGNLYVTSRRNNLLVKLDHAGRVCAEREISHPDRVFLSRRSSQQRFVGVTQEESNTIFIFAAADLSPVASQDLGASMTGMFNSEIVAPHLVYMSNAARHEILTFADHTRAFHREASYQAGRAPGAFTEGRGGIFVCCPGSGDIWVQKQSGALFERFTQENIGRPVAAVSLNALDV